MSRLEKVIAYFSPETARKRAMARTDIARQEKVTKIINQGYGSHGASHTKQSMRLWNPSIGDADTDIHDYLDDLRARSRDLAVGGSIVTGANKKIKTNVVGTGLRMKPAFDKEFLGLTDEQAAALKTKIIREWSLWAESKNCDAAGLNDFYGLQQLALGSRLESGDVFALLPTVQDRHSPYDLRVNLVESDRCSSPNFGDTEKIKSGVEVDDNGRVIAYHISSGHPGAMNRYASDGMKWTRVVVRGADTGRINVLHLLDVERPGQLRGVPIIAPVIEALKKLDRYTEAELTAAVIQSMFTVFITSPDETDESPFGIGVPDTGNVEESDYGYEDDVKMGEGAVQRLDPGEDVKFADPSRPSTNFDPFVTAILRQIGTALEIPYELLVNHFTSSYSASRAALLEAWKMFKMRRFWLAKSFCQPIYEEWFIEAVIKGRIDAPGIFDDPAILRAYTKATWHGPAQGMLDPVKEADAAIKRVENMFSTRAAETAELTGGEWEDNVQQQHHEVEMLKRYGFSASPADTAQPAPSGVGDEEDDSDDDLEGGEEENGEETQA